MREEYPDRIMEGLSTPVESGVGLVAPFTVVIEAQFLDDVPVVLLRQVLRSRQYRKPSSSLRCSTWTKWWSCPLWCKTGIFVQTVQKPMQFLDKVVVLPVVVQDRCVVETLRILWRLAVGGHRRGDRPVHGQGVGVPVAVHA